MSTQEIVNGIMKEIKPTVSLEGVDNIIEGGFLDSMELMGLISELMEKFNVEIDVDYITPENFNSLEAMARMIDQIKNG